jgi:hypothetical protein
MLWMKACLETRWRLVYALAIPLAALALPHVAGNGAASGKDSRAFLGQWHSSEFSMPHIWLARASKPKRLLRP